MTVSLNFERHFWIVCKRVKQLLTPDGAVVGLRRDEQRGICRCPNRPKLLSDDLMRCGVAAAPDINDYSAALAGLAPKMRVGAGKPQDVPSVTLTWSSQGSRK